MLKIYKKYLKKHFVISKNIIYKIRIEKLTIVEIFFKNLIFVIYIFYSPDTDIG